MKAVVTVIGKDCVGIISKVSGKCAEDGANIIDISQTVMRDWFAMMMLVDIDGIRGSFGEFVDDMKRLGEENGLSITAMHEDIFNTMHHI